MRRSLTGTHRRVGALLLTAASWPFVLGVLAAPVSDNVKVLWLSWVGLLSMTNSLLSWGVLRREIIGAYPALLVVAYLFMFGQAFLWALGMDAGSMDVRLSFDSGQVVLAQVFTLLGLSAYHFGGLLVAPLTSSDLERGTVSGGGRDVVLAGVRVVGWILLVVSAIPFAMVTARKVVVATTLGYVGLYHDVTLTQTGLGGMTGALADYFPLALIALLAGYSSDRMLRLCWVGLGALVAVVDLYVGTRGSAVVLAVVLTLTWHYFVGLGGTRRIVAVGLLAWALLSVIPVVHGLRNEASRSLSGLVEAWMSSVTDSSGIATTVGEAGGSMFPLAATMELVPSQFPFRYGMSYVYALTTVVPNLGFWEIHPGYRATAFGNWLIDALGLNYSPAFSWAAEAYINFGWCGIGWFLLLGVVSGGLFGRVSARSARQRPDQAVFLLMVLAMVMLTTRNSFVATVRAFTYFAGPAYVGIRLTVSASRVRSRRLTQAERRSESLVNR